MYSLFNLKHQVMSVNCFDAAGLVRQQEEHLPPQIWKVPLWEILWRLGLMWTNCGKVDRLNTTES